MTAQFALHPDDELALLKIRRYLIGYRITNGWTQPQLSLKINGTKGMVWDLESNTTWQWRLSRLQDWPVPFGMRLRAVLVARSRDLTRRIHRHPEVATALALSRTAGNRASWQRVYLSSALSVTRLTMNMSTAELGRLLGITAKAVCNWENTADEMLLCKLLHHARVLGGHIDLGLEEENG